MEKTVLISMPIDELQTVIIDCVNSCLKYHNWQVEEKDSDQLLNIEQAANFLNLKVPTIYGLVSRSAIPNSKKGKRLYFSKNELLDWIKSGKNKTHEELDREADSILKS